MYKLRVLKESFAICKLAEDVQVDFNKPYTFWARTDEEISLVCPQAAVPCDVTAVEADWRGIGIKGQLDFSLLGILATIAQILARNDISIFVVSTYDTDYIFVKEDKLAQAVNALDGAGYQIAAE